MGGGGRGGGGVVQFRKGVSKWSGSVKDDFPKRKEPSKKVNYQVTQKLASRG